MDGGSKGEDKEKEPVTPEQVEGEVEVDRCDVVIPPTAPKGKPKLPPLIQKKIKPGEAGEEESGPNSGSKIPLLKTKLVDDEEKKQPKKFTFNVRSGLKKKEDVSGTSNSRLRPQTGASTSSGVDRNDNRNGEAGKQNRGFVMKRGAQESAGVIARKGSAVGIAVGASSSQRSLTTAFQKKMTKVDSAPLQPSGVKSLAGMAGSVASKLNVSIPSAALAGKAAETVTTGDSVPLQNSTDGNPKSQMETAAETATSNFKTVQEFLDMPETTLPETGAGSGSTINTKKTFYKSKFWQYIDPNAKPETATKFKDPKKYNPDEVKSFMQKQKEVRKRQQIKMSKEKKEEYEKRQNMLKQLDTKCKNLAQKSKQRATAEPSPPIAKHLESVNEAKKRKLELESPSLKYLTPLLERQQGLLLRKSGNLPSDASKQAKFLLSEFENIVKRECISFLERIPISSSFKLQSKKVDKAVGTQYEGEKESQTQEADDQGKPLGMKDKEGAKIKSIASPESIEKAVTKIQAFYRGNKVRRTLKLAKIEFPKSLWRKHSDEPQQQQQPPGQRRRWSFPRPPEKPYDNSLQNKILPMSPIPFGGSSTRMIPCYIPPPPPDSLNHTSRSPSRPIVVPSSPFTPVRKRVYDEPYPQQLKNSSSTSGIFPPPSQRHSLPNRSSFNNIAVPTPQPSVMDVLREKIRLFSAGPEVPDKDGQGQSTLQERRDMICKAVSAHLSSTELSPRSVTSRQQISDELHESQVEIIPIERKHKRRKKRRDSSPAIANDSTTTVDTDLDYANGVRHTSSKSAATSLSQKPSDSITATSGTTLSSTTSVVDPSLSSSFGEFLAPALKLRYEAEKEHLKIIEKALQVKLQKAERVESAQQVTNETVKETGKKSAPDSDRVQLAIANCHKESMKAAAEMAKWMADFQKTTQGQQEKEVRQPVDLAAVVFAAVEDARILGEERRREKEMQKIIESSSKKEPTEDHDSGSATPTPVYQQQKRQEVETVDRSAETSLILNEMVGQTMDRMPFVTVRDKMLKDYQQQYPSATESERESPEQFATVTSLPAPAQGDEEEASIISEKISKSDQVEVVSTPKSSSTLKSAEVVSEVVFSEEVSKTEPDIVDDASIEDAPGSLSVSKVESLKEHKDDDSTIVSEPEMQSGEVITEHQSVDDAKSEDVSYGHVSIHEIEDEEAEIVSELALKEEEEQFPSTFESEATTPELSTAPGDRDASVEKSKVILEEGEEQNKEEPVKVELRQDDIPPLTSSATYSDESQSSSGLLTHKEIDDGRTEEEIVKSESPEKVIKISEQPLPIEPDEKIVEADEPSLPEDVASQTEEEEDNVELSMKTNNGESESPLIPEEDSNKDGSVSSPELSKPSIIDDDENANVPDPAEELMPENIIEAHGRLPIKPPPPYSVAVKSIIESPKSKEMFAAIEEMTGGRGSQKDTQDDEEVESEGDSDSSAEPNLIEANQQRRETAIDEGPTDEYIEDDYFTKSDYQAKDIPLKPPPPYSPSSSLDSTSLSGKSLLISLDNDKIEKVVQEQAEYVWDRWIRGEFQGEQDFPDIDEVMHELHLKLPEERTELSRSVGANPEIVQTAVLSFDYLLRHLTWFIIKEVLQVESPHDTFIDNVRPGPLVLQAQKLKLPKTKEALISTVIARVTDDMRPSFISESVEPELEPKKKRWCSRHRELVDEILLDELVNEDYQWTEWWPEEAVVKHNASLEIIRGLVKGALRNRRYVNNQN